MARSPSYRVSAPHSLYKSLCPRGGAHDTKRMIHIVRPGRKVYTTARTVLSAKCVPCRSADEQRPHRSRPCTINRTGKATRATRRGEAGPGSRRAILIRIPIRNRVATRHVGHSSRPESGRVYDGHLRSGIKRREACVRACWRSGSGRRSIRPYRPGPAAGR